jgi:hypothetical protein
LVKDRLSTDEGSIQYPQQASFQGGIQNPLAKDSVNTLLVGGRGFSVVWTTHGAVFFLYTIIISIVFFE